jgi:hypothetical protein
MATEALQRSAVALPPVIEKFARLPLRDVEMGPVGETA